MFLTNLTIYAKESGNQILSPNGTFDHIYDRFGNSLLLDEIKIEAQERNGIDKTTSSCSAGYFNLYFEANSGMEGNSTLEVDRRNVICQLFNDLSQFIVPADPGVTVNIWVRDISAIIPNPSSTLVLGLASSYYTLPANAPAYTGIIDNEIWKTINSGTNSYTNVTSPLLSTDGPNPAFYHGAMAFNFSNASINWHTDLTQTTPAGAYDLYTIALHETTHAFGFASLIDSNGESKLGAVNQYYSRYDLYLNTGSSAPLITNTGNCSLYNYGFNPALNPNIMAPSSTNCSTQLQFNGSVNQAIYTPTQFFGPSSLSHLEDLCHVPNSYPDNEYYVMSDANDTGSSYMKRYLKPEERDVLCDLGYRVNTTYGNPSNLNSFNYGGSPCLGLQVAGINDGIDTGGFYQHIVNVGSTITISSADILQNDYNAVSFECLEDIYAHGTPNVTSGTTFNYTATSPGLALLRYIPVAASGNKGNITYLFIYVQGGTCAATACNIVNNGGVEDGVNCGELNNTINCPNPLVSDIYCWTPLCGTPDYYVRGCVDSVCLGGSTYYTVPSTLENPVIDTWNSSNTTNNKMLGFQSLNYSPTTLNEAIQVSLKTPLIPNQSYTLKVVGRVVDKPQNQWSNLPGVLEFGGSPNLLAQISYFFNSLPPALTPLAQITIPNNRAWNSFTVTITNTSATPINYLTIINAGYLNNNPTGTRNYTLIDDVTIIETNELGVIDLPEQLCINNPIQDLSLYLTPAPAGGVFTGNGVNYNGTLYSFDPMIAGLGDHEICYTYTTNLGCIKEICDTISVLPIPAVSLPPFNPSILCHNGNPVPIPMGTPTGGSYSGTGVSGSNFDPVIAGIGTHQVIYTYSDDSGTPCSNSDTSIVTVELCSSVNDVVNDLGFLIYPNPNTGLFTIEKPDGLRSTVQLKIFDVSAKLILEKTISIDQQKMMIDITTYSKGIYQLQLIVDGEQFTRQIIKK